MEWLLPFVITGFFLLWLLFSYYTIKLTTGIKKALGSNYYLLPNKWPNIDNSDTRKAIKDSPELTLTYKVKNRLFVVLLVYLFTILIPTLVFIYYFGSIET